MGDQSFPLKGGNLCTFEGGEGASRSYKGELYDLERGSRHLRSNLDVLGALKSAF